MNVSPPPICGACGTMAHDPRPDCPEPSVCTYEPGQCGNAGCVNAPRERRPAASAMDRRIAQVVAHMK